MLEDDLKSLNLTRSTLGDLKKNYTALVFKYHPDRKNGDRAMFTKVFDAYKRLLRYTEIKDEIGDVEKEYVGSDEERADILRYYKLFKGDIGRLIEHLMFSKYADEDRIRGIIDKEIESGRVRRYRMYKKRISEYRKRREKNVDIRGLQAEILSRHEQKWNDWMDKMEEKYNSKRLEK